MVDCATGVHPGGHSTSETLVDEGFLRELGGEIARLGAAGWTTQREVRADLARLGGLVFTHCLTEPARALLRATPPTDVHLALDEQLVDLPWELCHDGQEFLGLRHRIGRRVLDATAPDVRDAEAAPDRLRVLVIADPTGTLPQAGAEAEDICALLDAIPEADVTLLGGSAVRRVNLLAAIEEHDVVHFAGHSHWDPLEPSHSGWRLAEGVLTASALSKLRRPPRLVFSNSCEAGAVATRRGGYRYEGHALGIGSAFLRAGVRSYVGTFWVIHDAESVRIALDCYRALAGGATLGAALQGARRAAADVPTGGGLTWASYVLYGDPGFAPLAASASAAPDAGTASPGAALPYRFDVRLDDAGAAAAPSIDRVAATGAPLIGRDAELAALASAYDAAIAGQRQVVLLTGPPGIGKTALTDAFLARLEPSAPWIARGQSIEQYGSGEPYLPVLEAWTRLGRPLLEPLRRHAPTWLAQMPGLLDSAAQAELAQRAQGSSRERMLREMTELLEAVATERPVVLVLEDLHWSDHSTLELLAYVAQRRASARLLVVGTYRAADVMRDDHPLRRIVQELTTHGRCRELALAPLAEADVGAYLDARLAGAVVPPDVTALVHRRTDGHPLFVVNVVDYAVRQGLLVEAAGQWRLAGGARALEADVPDTLRPLIARQVEALPPAERATLEVASLAGPEFSTAAVAAGLESSVDEVEDRCEALAWRGQFVAAAGLAEWPDGTVAGRYRFVHALYRDVLAERVSEARRVRVHRRLGARKEQAYGRRATEIAGELAAHFEGGREPRRALDYLLFAGDGAVRRHAHREAIAHYEHARALLAACGSEERSAVELDVLLRLVGPLMTAHGYAAREVETVFARAHALARQLAPDLALRPLLRGLVSFHQVRGEPEHAYEVGVELLAACEGSDAVARVQAHYGHGVTLYDLAQLDAAADLLQRALAEWTPETATQHLAIYGGYEPGAACHGWLGWIHWLRGDADRAVREADAGVAAARRLGHPFTLAFAELAAAIVHSYRGDAKRARPHLEAGLGLARNEGFAYQRAFGTSLEGWVLLLEGHPDEACRRLDEARALQQETGARVGRPSFLTMSAMAKAFTGRFDDALVDLETGIAETAASGHGIHLGTLHRARGNLRRFQGLPGAEEDFTAALAYAESVGARAIALQAATSLAGLWLDAGRGDDARALLAPRYAAFTEGLDTPDLQSARALLERC